MSLELPSDLRDFVDQAVGAGKYSSPADVVVAALRQMKDQVSKAAHDDWLRKELAIGIAELERGEGIDSEEAFRQLAEKYPDIFDESHDDLEDAI